MMTDPLRRLEAEHEQALRMLKRLEDAVLALEAGQPEDPLLATVREAYEFLTSAVREHNESEEAALFPLLEGVAPTELFTAEHVELRSLEDELRDALSGAAPRRDVVRPAHAIVNLLRSHIGREDEVLFPMARALLGRDGLIPVARRLGD